MGVDAVAITRAAISTARMGQATKELGGLLVERVVTRCHAKTHADAVDTQASISHASGILVVHELSAFLLPATSLVAACKQRHPIISPTAGGASAVRHAATQFGKVVAATLTVVDIFGAPFALPAQALPITKADGIIKVSATTTSAPQRTDETPTSLIAKELRERLSVLGAGGGGSPWH